MRPTIVIMADFGFTPYAWLRKAEDSPPYVGSHIASGDIGFPKEFGVPEDIEEKFAEWADDFVRNYDKESFNWSKWNEHGIDLARKLKTEVGERYHVEYHVPMEDPAYSKDTGIITIG